MKRSEMLKIIWDVLHPTEIGWEDLDGSLSEEVLKAIEKAGMLPPTQKVGEIPVVVEGAYTKWHPKNAWEPEND